MDFILILQSIAQGIVQGITEWLPISSTGHILLLDAIWPINVGESTKEFMDIFKVVIQLGSILAVLVLYFHRLNPFSPKKTAEQKKETFSLWAKVLIGSVPVAIVGLLIDDLVDDVLSVPSVIAATLIIYGIAFIVIESRKHTPRINTIDDMSYKTAVFIGMFEMLALIPGTSRSGATIIGATLLGTSRTVAAEFSFFMALPAMLGASGIKMLKALLDGSLMQFTADAWIALAIATVVSFVVSLLAIRFLMSFIQKHDFKAFGWYRIVLGIVIIAVLIFAPSVFKTA